MNETKPHGARKKAEPIDNNVAIGVIVSCAVFLVVLITSMSMPAAAKNMRSTADGPDGNETTAVAHIPAYGFGGRTNTLPETTSSPDSSDESKSPIGWQEISEAHSAESASQESSTLPPLRKAEPAVHAKKKKKRVSLGSNVNPKLKGARLKNIPEKAKLHTFALLEGRTAPTLETSSKKAIAKAIKAIAKEGNTCGFAFVNLKSGAGVAYNAGKRFYTASSFKAAVVFYALQRGGDGELAQYDRDNAATAIKYSDNDSYDAFAASRMGQDYTDWLDEYGIVFGYDTMYYANASAKSMARIWADVAQFLKTGTKDATWFANLLANTNRSFIRDAIGGKSVTVYNKAGWIDDYEYTAHADCAYIEKKGRPYLMAIMTDLPDTETADRRVRDLAKALFESGI